MSIFFDIFRGRKKTESYAYRLARAKELHGRVIRYVTERREDNDDVIGRGGSLCLHGDEFIVDASGDRVFVTDVRDLEAFDLLSGDGVIIRGPDKLSGGRVRSITVHFVYYRK